MSPSAEEPAIPILPRGRLARDLLGWFVGLSVGLHALTQAPWARLLVAMLSALGLHSDLNWKHAQDDHATVIPIDLDQLDDEPPPVAPTTPNGNGSGDGIGPKYVDAGLDANEAGIPDAPGDALAMTDGFPDAPKGDVGGNGDADANVDAGPPRVADPNKASGGLLGLKPIKGEVNVSVLVRTDHLRAHPIGKQLGGKLSSIPQWKPFLAGTGLDPVMDLDAIFADGPRFYETSRVTVILVHSKPDEELTTALHSIADGAPGSEWIGDDDVPAFRAKIDGANRVFVQIPGGLIITPPDGEKQALAIGKKMVEKHKRGKDLLPKGDTDLMVSGYIRKPSNILGDIPDDLTDIHITVRGMPDNGAAIDVDGKAKDDAHAKDDADVLRKLIESHLTGLQGAIIKKWIAGYTLSTDGDVVKLHHQLTGEQLNDIWTVLTALGML